MIIMKGTSRTVYAMVLVGCFDVRQVKCMKDSGVSERGKIVIWFIEFFMQVNCVIQIEFSVIQTNFINSIYSMYLSMDVIFIGMVAVEYIIIRIYRLFTRYVIY